MKSTRFKSLATEDDNMSQNTFKTASSQSSLPANSRWKSTEQDMRSNPFRRKTDNFTSSSPPPTNSRWQCDDESNELKRPNARFPHSDRRGNDGRDRQSAKRFTSNSPPPTNSRWQCDDESNELKRPNTRFPHSDRRGNDGRDRQSAKRFTSNSPVLTNSRWRRDPADRSDEPRRATSGFSNSFRGRRGGDERGRGRRRGGGRDAFNSFNRKTKRAPKPVFNLENTNFPVLGKVESPTSLPSMLNFSKAASKNKDRAGPKHMTQFPERMPRTKKEVDDDRDPLDWNTDDEEESNHTETCNEKDPEPDWPAKGGYID